jgi:hypothetical protein
MGWPLSGWGASLLSLYADMTGEACGKHRADIHRSVLRSRDEPVEKIVVHSPTRGLEMPTSPWSNPEVHSKGIKIA